MAVRTPSSLNALCRNTLPLLLDKTNGRQMLKQVSDLVESERWNSFDRFHHTTEKLVEYYEQSGAVAEVDVIQSGGQIGSGRWIIQETADVRAATVDIVSPFKERLLNYKENPWHIIQWSAATPKEGLRATLVVLDERADIERLPVGSLRGKVVLTRQDPRSLLGLLADRGAVGVLSDRPVPNFPHALAWTKFGWGAIPMEHATARLAGFVLSQRQGEKLRRQLQKHGQLSLLLKADIRKYIGSHDVVSGIVRGSGDPQDEIWAIAHSAEPGAADNASGVVQTLEIARLLEGLITSGKLARPRRSIRLLNAYECYGFFSYLERKRRLQTPLAGVCIDTVGIKPAVCGGRLEWHATIPMSAGFVDRIGASILRATLRQHQPGYRLFMEPFVSTSDTLIGDPHYGFPCPWITTHHKREGSGFDAYHSSADQIGLLSAKGMETCAASMAAYLYYLADMGSGEVAEIGRMEGAHFAELAQNKASRKEADYLREAHSLGNERLKRWLWGGDRRAVLAGLAAAEGEVSVLCEKNARPEKKERAGKAARQIPRRTAFLSPTPENAPVEIGRRIQRAGVPSWALFWADGRRSIAEIAERVECEETASVGGGRTRGRRVDMEKFVDYFSAHAELGYVELLDPEQMLSKKELVADLRALGIKKGMDLMVHSSLSAIGHVRGGAATVVEALFEVVGRSGTLLMPSFNHRAAEVYNPMATPTTNGSIPDVFWRCAETYRSQHPTHAVAASGARAEWYCSEHLDVGIWAAESPIGKLVHNQGYILALGTTHWTSTAYHVAEMAVPCGCIDSFANEDRVVGAKGQVQAVRGLAFRGGECPVSIDTLEAALDRRHLQQRGSVGKAAAQWVLASDLWNVRCEQLRNACPSCSIKPVIR
ncbi:MAG: AAC(3) family N-acetyltransferase [Candidatus Latescibacterota bacterium]|jgi:aminoglycoside 3-N-acetyltransferase